MKQPEVARSACRSRLEAADICLKQDFPGGELFEHRSSAAGPVELDLSWFGPSGLTGEGSEAVIQAASGMMHVHGRDSGDPRRIGFDIASIAAGLLAAIGVMAGLVGRLRGMKGGPVRTSALQAAILYMSHYIAMATGTKGWLPLPATGTGPPFRSADGAFFEIETLDPNAWRGFWEKLGLAGDDLGEGWRRFYFRYPLAICSLPSVFAESCAARPLKEIAAVGREAGITVLPVRGAKEFLDDLGDWTGLPVIEPVGEPEPPPADDPAGSPAGDTGPQSKSRGGRATGDPGPKSSLSAAPRGEGGEALPLHGVKVLEATTLVQGPLAGLLLSMLGAEVTKVEPPGGDPGRLAPPLAGGRGVVFSCFNRTKRPLVLDLSKPEGREELLERAAETDVFLNNWRPGRAEKWNLTPDVFARSNRSIIWAKASGWGPLSMAPGVLGTDAPAQAYTGMGELASTGDEPPLPSRMLLADLTGGLMSAEGVVSALLRRELGERALAVETSLVAGAAALHDLNDRGLHSRHENGALGTPDPAVDLVAMTTDGSFAGMFDHLGDGCYCAAAPWTE